jgi:hypothetical protein
MKPPTTIKKSVSVHVNINKFGQPKPGVVNYRSPLDREEPPEVDLTAVLLGPVEGTFLLPIRGNTQEVAAKKAELLAKHGQGKLRQAQGNIVKFEVERPGVLHFTRAPTGWVARIAPKPSV